MTTYDTIRAAATPALAFGTRNTDNTVNGTTLDRETYKGARALGLVVAVAAITDGVHEFSFWVSDDGTTWREPTDPDDVQGSLGAITSVPAGGLLELGYTGDERYARLSVTTTDTTSGGEYGAWWLLGDSRRSPIERP